MESVSVRIFGENYSIRTDQAASRLEELARHVDTRMREVAATGKVVVTSKIAVLAALHIAEELFRLRDSARSASPSDHEQRLAALVESLDRALAAAAEAAPCVPPPPPVY